MLSRRIKEDIDEYCIKTYDEGPRSHLGASLIGHSCSRYLWFVFRWVAHKQHTGRLYRLFDRGKREEARFIEWLRGIGFEVWEVDDNGEQFRVSMAHGHGGGSLDGACKVPEDYCMNGQRLLTEFKTHGTGQGFNNLKSNGVAVAHPQHFAQMSVYGRYYDLKYGLYMSINKNDDDLHVEVVDLNWNLADELIAKAERIIMSQEPPERLSESSTHFECKYCDYLDICHNGAKPNKNCRSCVNAKPIESKQWACGLYDQIIPDEWVKQGCDSWKPII